MIIILMIALTTLATAGLGVLITILMLLKDNKSIND